MLEIEQIAGVSFQDADPDTICSNVAQYFQVRKTEIALLKATGNVLKFLYPAELKAVGAIPLSGSAVAARTARTKRAELFNTFTRVKHSSVFEVVRLGQAGADTEVIQKLMSAPILNEAGEVLGVVQVSRKAHSPAKAGPDFTSEDLTKLKAVAHAMSKVLADRKA
jgi:hypothetical protein